MLAPWPHGHNSLARQARAETHPRLGIVIVQQVTGSYALTRGTVAIVMQDAHITLRGGFVSSSKQTGKQSRARGRQSRYPSGCSRDLLPYLTHDGRCSLLLHDAARAQWCVARVSTAITSGPCLHSLKGYWHPPETVGGHFWSSHHELSVICAAQGGWRQSALGRAMRAAPGMGRKAKPPNFRTRVTAREGITRCYHLTTTQ